MEMITEIPKGLSNKYELIKEKEGKGKWKLDRVLAGSLFYPEEYGFIPKTLDYDGDPLDVICLNLKKTFPGCYIPIRIIGILEMIDKGEKDDKIIAVNDVEPRLSHINDIKDVNENKLNEIKNFFLRYKELEKKKVIIGSFKDKKEAEKVLKNCQIMYEKNLSLIKKDIEKNKLVKLLKKKN